MLLIGKTALARGMAMDQYVFLTLVCRVIVRSVHSLIAAWLFGPRAESGFDQRDKSPANAVGPMQVTPEAGRNTAKRFGVAYDWNRPSPTRYTTPKWARPRSPHCSRSIVALT